MLSCRELAHRHASDYLDGQLGWHVRVGVYYHLLICHHCRRFVAQLRKVRLLLRNKPIDRPVIDAATQALAVKLGEIYAEQKKSLPPL